MGAEEAIESYIDDINNHLETIRQVTKKVLGEKDSNAKSQIAKDAEEPISEIEEIFKKKFVDKHIQRCQGRVEEFQSTRQTLEEKFETLKKNLRDAIKLGGGNETVQPTRSTNDRKIQNDDPDAEFRRQEKARKREEEEKQKQERILRETNGQPEEVNEVLKVQQDTLEALARSKGINVETLKIADRIGQKLAEQTEQMERIQAKLDELGDGISRAKKEVASVMRGIATDKIILAIICCIIFAGIIIVLIRIGYGIYQSVSGNTSLFPSSTAQKAPSSSSTAIVFKYSGGNIQWNKN